MLYPIKTDGAALDLFAGSGQIGIEFLSRGLDLVYFNEIDRFGFKVLKANLGKIKDNNYILTKFDYKLVLEDCKNKDVKFDYIFLDPPYDTCYIDKSLSLIKDYELLNEDGIVITESDRELDFDGKYDLYLYKKKTYGRKIVKIYTK